MLHGAWGWGVVTDDHGMLTSCHATPDAGDLIRQQCRTVSVVSQPVAHRLLGWDVRGVDAHKQVLTLEIMVCRGGWLIFQVIRPVLGTLCQGVVPYQRVSAIEEADGVGDAKKAY